MHGRTFQKVELSATKSDGEEESTFRGYFWDFSTSRAGSLLSISQEGLPHAHGQGLLLAWCSSFDNTSLFNFLLS